MSVAEEVGVPALAMEAGFSGRFLGARLGARSTTGAAEEGDHGQLGEAIHAYAWATQGER